MKIFFKAVISAFLFCSIFLCSCSDSEPDLSSATGTVIIDYQKENSNPEIRMAVFCMSKSDSRRSASFVVENLETKLQWRVYDPEIFKNGSSWWTGCSKLYPEENNEFPQGLYRFEYIDKAGNTSETKFLVSYKKEFLTMNAKQAGEKLSEGFDSFTEKIALYDKNDTLVYFDKWRSSWKGWQDIERDCDVAVKMRRVYCRADNSQMVFLVDELK